MPNSHSHRRRFILSCGIVSALFFLVLAGLYASVSIWPGVGAQGADLLRRLVGDEAVARVEGLVFQVQDRLHQWEYSRGAKPDAPWAVAEPASPARALLPTVTSSPAVEIADTPALQSPVENQAPSPTQAPTATSVPPPSATPTWVPPAVTVSGSLTGEGQWSPYIQDASGKVVSYRAFLQPDPDRPYALAAVVAFDLTATRLHYIIGTDEPISEVKVDRPGTIPAADKQPGVLLAVFNGGFKARHGRFGVMVNDTVVIPPRDGLGTLVIYRDGTVRIREWGSDITSSPDILVWRQNGPLIIQNGKINPRTAENSTWDWGSTVDGEGVIPTWRSALGISSDGKNLYYVAGKDLTIPALAQALVSIGASEAIQLDINNYWVHFGTISFEGGKPVTLPLFTEMNDNVNRYLDAYSRDFFYVTSLQ